MKSDATGFPHPRSSPCVAQSATENATKYLVLLFEVSAHRGHGLHFNRFACKVLVNAETGKVGCSTEPRDRVSPDVFAFPDYSTLVTEGRISGFVGGVFQYENITFAVSIYFQSRPPSSQDLWHVPDLRVGFA